MDSLAGTRISETEQRSCTEDLESCDKSFKEFMNYLENRERYVTQSLKNINDTLEALVNVRHPEIPEFLLREPSELVLAKEKSSKKRSRGKKQCCDDSAAKLGGSDEVKSSGMPEAMSFKDLAKKFEIALKEAKEQGLSQLIKPIKESVKILRELSQAGSTCEIETTLDYEKQENGGETPCCSCGKSSGDRLNGHRRALKREKTCNRFEDKLQSTGDTGKSRRRRTSKHRKDPKICVEGIRIEKKMIGKRLEIQDPDMCDCSAEDLALETLDFEKNAIGKKSSPENRRKIEEQCSDNDLSIPEDRSMIHAPNVTVTKFGVKDKHLAFNVVVDDHEHCPLEDATNAKDEACQSVVEGKESGRTSESHTRFKDHAVKDGGESGEAFNVERCRISCIASCAAISTDGIGRSSPAKEIVILQSTCQENDQSDEKEKSICRCGCDIVEEPVNQTCPCSCSEVVEYVDDASSDRNNIQLFCKPAQSIICERRRIIERPKYEDHLILGKNESLKKCAQVAEENEMSEIGEVAFSRRKHNQNTTEENEQDIQVLAKRLEEEIHSVKAKNDELKKLIKSCYCDEDVEAILALQFSQLPPIRATRSGLMGAIKVLQSKCHTKDRMISALACELRGSKSVDEIAKNLTAPCLQFTYWDFDQCGLYLYLQNRKLLSSAAEASKADDKSVPERAEVHRREIYRTPKPTDFRVIREVCNCLLVSWKIPGDIRGLRGYEIVVNGNVVAARVRNPTRTEAVVGPFDLSGSTKQAGSIILTLYAVDSHGQHSEPSSIKF